MEEQRLSKAARLHKITHLLYRNPHGLSSSELARHCGVTPRTIQRDLQALEEEGIPIWEDEGRYGITQGYYLPPIHFTLEEASALYLAARLLARYSDEHNPVITHALAKLAGVMPQAIAHHIQHTVRSLAYRPENPEFARVFETIALGWATGRKVRIWHQAADSENLHEYLLCPYFLEPSSVGYATYAIGHSTWFDDVRTFKLERIREAQLTQETFEIPDGFDGPALLGSAWGVMFGDAQQEVTLRFTPDVTRRLKESVWHPSQKLKDCDDGGCILRVWVAHPLEMKPFIRGWGPDCEVLSPEWLRQEISQEMHQAAEVYREGQAGETNGKQ